MQRTLEKYLNLKIFPYQELRLTCLGHLCFKAIFTKGGKVFDILTTASLNDKTFQKVSILNCRNLFLKEQMLSLKS